MTRVINQIGDRMLAALLGKSAAGACVPDMGEYCGCLNHGLAYCLGKNGQMYQPRAHKYISCSGPCAGNTYCPGDQYWSSRCP